MASDRAACEHESITTLVWDDSKRPAMWMCADCRRKFEPVNVALHEAAHETLHWLEGRQERDADGESRRERQEAIDALRAALEVKR